MVNQRRLALPNPHLIELSEDYLYHLGLTTNDDLSDMFSDTKVKQQWRGRVFTPTPSPSPTVNYSKHYF